MQFDANMSTFDRQCRLVIGLILLAFIFVGPKSPYGLLGLILLATSVVGTCPFYGLVGYSTNTHGGAWKV